MTRVAFVVYVDLDDTPGKPMHSKESAQNTIRQILWTGLDPCNLVVSLAPLTMQPNADLKKLLGGFPTPPITEDAVLTDAISRHPEVPPEFFQRFNQRFNQRIRTQLMKEDIPNAEMPFHPITRGERVEPISPLCGKRDNTDDHEPCILLAGHELGPKARGCRSVKMSDELAIPDPEIHATNYPSTCLFYRLGECGGGADVSMGSYKGKRVPMCPKHLQAQSTSEEDATFIASPELFDYLYGISLLTQDGSTRIETCGKTHNTVDYKPCVLRKGHDVGSTAVGCKSNISGYMTRLRGR